eukprot:jgi/Psemu1/20535/gm1.20535_g
MKVILVAYLLLPLTNYSSVQHQQRKHHKTLTLTTELHEHGWVLETGFEPATKGSLRFTPKCTSRESNSGPNDGNKSFHCAPDVGIEPTTTRLKAERSSN